MGRRSDSCESKLMLFSDWVQQLSGHCSLSDKETDLRDKLMPSVTYLQRLGPEYLEQIFGAARWVFEQDADIAFEVCTCWVPHSTR